MKTYELEITLSDDGALKTTVKSNGFINVDELGILEFKRNDILDQMSGKIKPDIVKRTVVED